jgi:hypothetical protein
VLTIKAALFAASKAARMKDAAMNRASLRVGRIATLDSSAWTVHIEAERPGKGATAAQREQGRLQAHTRLIL